MSKSLGVLPVACTGAPGAYSEAAARRAFGPSVPTLTVDTLDAALAALEGGKAQRAVVAVENSVTGHFDGVVEALFKREVSVTGEVVVPIRHSLLALPGTSLAELAVVTSHPSALAQCRDWLSTWGVATRAAENTSHAARELARSRDAALGVLGSRTLAELYELEVLADGLSDRSDNETRFLLLAREAESDPSATRTALLIGPLTAPRALKTLRIQLEAYSARRTRAPFLGTKEGTHYLVEFDHEPGRGRELAKLSCGEIPWRLLGSWTP